MMEARAWRWLTFLLCLISSLQTNAFLVGITYVENAVAKGAGVILPQLLLSSIHFHRHSPFLQSLP